MLKKHQISIVALLLLGTTSSAIAQNRPDSRLYTCDEARSIIRDAGAIVMTTGRFTYERVVRNRSYCEFDEDTLTVFAPTKDRRKCPIGGKCVTGFFKAPGR